MITVRLNGGLGNQMFQYATAKALAFLNETNLLLDINEFDTYDLRDLELDKYSIKDKTINQNYLVKKVIKKLKLETLFDTYYVERSLKYNDNLNYQGSKLYLEGYFQSEKYFFNIRDELLTDFTIANNVSEYTKLIEKQILDKYITVSLHIRRGDYVSNKNTNNIHGTCDLEYYSKAINLLNDKFEEIKYFVFSDDISWVKENLKINNVVYVDSEEKRIPHEDIYLMSLCNHNIIANSSFSWWGAWLNQNDDKVVIAPKKWFASDDMIEESKDIICDEWITI